MENWDMWLSAALSTLSTRNLLRSTRPIDLSSSGDVSSEFETFEGPHRWDRASVEVELEKETFRHWLRDLPLPCGGKDKIEDVSFGGKMLLFSGNDYLGLSTHPAVRKAAAMAARQHGMGPRGSALICGYTNYHRLLEASLAGLKKKEDCLLCPTGFAANMAFISALGSVSSLLVAGRKPSKEERIAIFSDALNHASIIDGICLTKQLQEVEVFIYRHCDMEHLNTLLSCCKISKKVVITDSLFSMDGDFAPVRELVHLRKKHGFLLVFDDAHATLVCGEGGGGVPEIYDCENDIDICLGTLSKAAGCHGGFIACRSHKFLIEIPLSTQSFTKYCLLTAEQQEVETANTIKGPFIHIFNFFSSSRCCCFPRLLLALGSRLGANLCELLAWEREQMGRLGENVCEWEKQGTMGEFTCFNAGSSRCFQRWQSGKICVFLCGLDQIFAGKPRFEQLLFLWPK